jgi:hypothetical protein
MTQDSNASRNGQSDTRAPMDHHAVLPEPPTPLRGGWSGILSAEERIRQEHALALTEAMREREAKRGARHAQEFRNNTALEEARWAREQTRKYEEAGDLLRENAQRRRQEQHCEKCGFLFNYDDRTLLPEPEWCDPRRLYCNEDLGMSFCVAWQARDVQAHKRQNAKRRGKTSGARGQPSRQPVSTHGQHGALASTDQEPL